MNKEEMREEKYYWETHDGKFIPVDELTDKHIVNIVIKFGKDRLAGDGHRIIINRFEKLRHEQNFFVQ